MTIKNVNFVADKDDRIFVDAHSTKNANVHNVTIDGCVFTNPASYDEVVGAKFRAAFDITLKNIQANGLHSLTQSSDVKGEDGFVVKDVVLKSMSEGGISLGTSTKVELENVDIEAETYGIRVEPNTNLACTLNIKNSIVRANIPVLVRYVNNENNNYTVNLEGKNTLTAMGSQIIVTANNYKTESDWAKPKAVVNITGETEGVTVKQ